MSSFARCLHVSAVVRRSTCRSTATVACRDALNSTGRPIVYSICEWGIDAPQTWGYKVGNAWRTSGDIQPTWSSMLWNLGRVIGLGKDAGPGGWNDPDMLEVCCSCACTGV
jgi:Alpha galactosidase A